jgi:hypothetical protein
MFKITDRFVEVVATFVQEEILFVTPYFEDRVVQVLKALKAHGRLVDMVDFKVHDEEIEQPDYQAQKSQQPELAIQIKIRPHPFHCA